MVIIISHDALILPFFFPLGALDFSRSEKSQEGHKLNQICHICVKRLCQQ